MLKKININGLFDKFDYEIDLKEEGITILTGPNGYGKTTILNMIYELTDRNFDFFHTLPFKEISLTLEDNEIKILKIEDTLEIRSGNKEQIKLKEGVDISIDSDTEKVLSVLNVYLIKEQRLIRNKKSNRDKLFFYPSDLFDLIDDYYDENREKFRNTIEDYARELSAKIEETLAKASKVGQEIDSSFPRRLSEETKNLSEKEFNKKYNEIKDKQRSLSRYGLSATEEENLPTFKKENAKALLVYLNDTEKKLAVFDDILQRLDIFYSILNQRQFVFKQIEISPDFGFRFKTEDGKELPLTSLSSGEQQEVVLLYRLIFRVEPDTLVLIDEPEISLHVAWQKEVIDDLLKIIKLQNITVITATHSPQIIGKHWDKVVDLWEISR